MLLDVILQAPFEVRCNRLEPQFVDFLDTNDRFKKGKLGLKFI